MYVYVYMHLYGIVWSGTACVWWNRPLIHFSLHYSSIHFIAQHQAARKPLYCMCLFCVSYTSNKICIATLCNV